MAWNATHYAINYMDFGFVKRGFIGSFYYFSNGSFTQGSLLLFQLSFIIFFIATTHYFFYKLGLNKSFIYILFILSPATFMQFGSDLGRFDPILVALFMLSIIYRKNPILFFTFSMIGILIHEIYVFALLPGAFLLYLSDRVKLGSLKEIFIESIKCKTLYFLILSILIVVLFGSYELGYEQILDSFSKSNLPISYIEYHTTNLTGEPLKVWTRSISDNLFFTSNKLTFNISTIYMVLVYLLLLIYLYLIGIEFKKPQYYLILISSFPMFLLGTDWGRWLAFIYISIFVIFITTERDKAAKIKNKHLLIFSLYGPLGVAGFLPPVLLIIYRVYQLM
ncbi:hypothetical protein NQT69_15870 [Pseudoalteromonas shioyasakiensis]|uniref:hypothetical protein n=1 Tax=Pseudoalteromonas shioyasakiensis TaxID=1190813 RepID=UPI002117ACE5|nr:hypothetical protein [Pseudoalteromonas shioyasakiensis]MCQ8879479.1 hypothetical protein [Pseudoalteromonas shioyasakiensis]